MFLLWTQSWKIFWICSLTILNNNLSTKTKTSLDPFHYHQHHQYKRRCITIIITTIIIITTKWEALRIRGSGVTLTVIATCSSRVGIKNPKLVFFSNFLHQKPRIICLHHGLKINWFFKYICIICWGAFYLLPTSIFKRHKSRKGLDYLSFKMLRHFMLPFLPLPLTYLCTHSHFLQLVRNKWNVLYLRAGTSPPLKE